MLTIKGLDRTNYLKKDSISITLRTDYKCDASFTLKKKFDDATGFFPEPGQKVELGPFRGIIHTVKYNRFDTGFGTDKEVEIEIQAIDYNYIPVRRTVGNKLYVNKYDGEIVQQLVEEVLSQEGIYLHTNELKTLIDEYEIDAKSIKTILDELAQMSGFKWYIRDDMGLFFGLDFEEITDYWTVLSEDGTLPTTPGIYYSKFENVFDDITYEKSLEDYRNKQFIAGGIGDDGYPVLGLYEDTVEIQRQKASDGYGSGVYGNLSEENDVTNQAGADFLAEQYIKRYGKKTPTLTFRTLTIPNPLQAGGRLFVHLPSYGILNKYFLVEEIRILEFVDDQFIYEFVCTEKDYDDFKPYNRIDYLDYFTAKFSQTNYAKTAINNLQRQDAPNLTDGLILTVPVATQEYTETSVS